MTEHPRNLAAWLDDELGADESAAVTQHVENCGQCQARARTYAQVTGLLAESLAGRRTARRWRAAVVWAGAIAAALVLYIALRPEKRVLVSTVPTAVIRAPKVDVNSTEIALNPSPRRVRRHRNAVRPKPPQVTFTDGPVVRVLLPADALFAPGAMPAGAQIYADLVLAADGSARELRLLP